MKTNSECKEDGITGGMYKMFRKWKIKIGYGNFEQLDSKENEKEGVKTHGIKHWVRVRTTSRINIQVRNSLQKGIG
eukprot:6211777-Pleurochrysis_carterae.AAC.9